MSQTSASQIGYTIEKPIRSIIKSVSYRVFGSMATAGISFFVTGNVSASLSIGAVEFASKFGLFYFHERLWNRIKIGKVTVVTDYEI